MNKQKSTKKKEILGKIKHCYDKGTLVPFIGAGFSNNIKGSPTWEDFIKELSKDLEKEEGFLLKEFEKGQNRNLRASEYYIYKKGNGDFQEGKKVFQRKLENIFKIKYTKNEQWNIHNIIVNLENIPLIYTTNWDDFLEKAVKGNDKEIIPIYQQSDFPQLRRNNIEDKKIIIKFHGDYQEKHLDTIIASELDYHKRMLEMNFLDIKFHYDLTHYNFIFMGFSFNDMNINYLLNAYYQVLERFDNHETFPDHYILTVESSSNLTLNLIERKGIIPYYLLSDETIKRFEDKKKDIWNTFNSEKAEENSSKGLESIAKKREKELDKLKDDKLTEIRKAYQLFFEELKKRRQQSGCRFLRE
ncbi:MAG: SIR2 family protein [Deltaproteobacteria bacterium]|nr:SIR2 family protein [Deltaproteobacteria bacterium]